MKSERVKKIINELVSYLLDLNASEIKIKLEQTDCYIKIEMINRIEDFHDRVIKELREKLGCERMVYIEELYWELLGENDGNQMNLLGNMIDGYNISREDDNRLKIVFYRKIK